MIKRPDIIQSIRTGIKGKPSIFSKEQIDALYEELLPLTIVTAEEKEAHIEKINDSKTQTSKKAEEPKAILCPKCGSPMILRTASKGANKGKKFYGCSNFPKCRSIVNIEGP